VISKSSDNSVKGQWLVAERFKGVSSYFSSYLKGGSCTHKYRHTFVCGGVAVVQYTQFRRAALFKYRWLQPCCCQTENELRKCDHELENWIESVEETEHRHFKFRRETALTLDLSDTETMILQPNERGAA
jgi:hypothetical protein